LFDEHGHIAKWYGTSTDIEDHKQAEEEAQEKREPVGRGTADFACRPLERNIDGGDAICSEETYRIFGLPPQTRCGTWNS